MLEDFGGGQHDLALAYLERARGADFDAALERLLAHDPDLATLTPEERERLFRALVGTRRPAMRSTPICKRRPEMLTAGWRGIAKQRASKGDFRGAYELTLRFGARPALPQITDGGRSVEDLQKAVFGDPNDYQAAFTLYERQRAAGQPTTRSTPLRRLTGMRDRAAVFPFPGSGSVGREKEDWERAWKAWEAFAGEGDK